MTSWLAALPIALLTLLPLAAVLWLALTPQPEVWQHLMQYVLPRAVGNTLVLMALVGLGVLLVGVPLAWLTAVCEFPGRRFFAWALVLPLAFPAYVLAFVQMGLLEYSGPVPSAWREVFGTSAGFPEIRGSLWGVTLVLVMAFYPYVYLLARSAFLTQGKQAMEVAQALGLGPLAAFWRVTLPMARPWIGAGLALALMETLADFGAVAVFNYDTVTTAVYKAWFDLHNLAAAAQIATLLIFVVLLLLATESSTGRARRYHAGSTQQPHLRLSSTARWAATLACSFVLAAAFVVPLLQLVAWSLQVWQTQIDERYWGFAWNSLQLAASSALLVTTLALVLSWIQRHDAGRLTAWTVRVATVGYALPGVVLAVGVIWSIVWLDHGLLTLFAYFGFEGAQVIQGSLAAMLLALSARFMAVAFQSTDSAMQRITRHQEEACASLGLGPLKTLFRLHLPLLKTGLLSGFLMVFVDVMKEMPITLMTRQSGWDTLAVRIYQFTAESFWAEASLPALTIVAIGLLPVALLVQQTEPRANRTPTHRLYA